MNHVSIETMISGRRLQAN